ncbi:hypothetical protein G6F37_013871 [Rhizopus arrhizus]|nr:hypothetical protein G6F38_013073 [Rhizopus arrhizus]KAG1135833.1 hypothetical protein G6F37_013871 [Rhizopus arrhizus]
MVLSAKNNFDQFGGLSNSPHSKSTSQTSPNQRSWVQVVTKNRKSLLHATRTNIPADVPGSTTVDKNNLTIIKTSTVGQKTAPT